MQRSIHEAGCNEFSGACNREHCITVLRLGLLMCNQAVCRLWTT